MSKAEFVAVSVQQAVVCFFPGSIPRVIRYKKVLLWTRLIRSACLSCNVMSPYFSPVRGKFTILLLNVRLYEQFSFARLIFHQTRCFRSHQSAHVLCWLWYRQWRLNKYPTLDFSRDTLPQACYTSGLAAHSCRHRDVQTSIYTARSKKKTL